jgi:hypothetical protein
MRQQLFSALKYLVSLGIALGLFAYLYKDEAMGQLLGHIAQADPFWVGLSVLTAVVSHAHRAARWQLALAPLGYRPAFLPAFLAVLASYFANIFVPRIGEVARAGLLRRTQQVPAEVSFGAIIAERALDLVILVGLSGVVLWLEFGKIGWFVQEQAGKSLGLLGGKALLLAGLALLGLGGLALLYYSRQWLLRLPLLQKAKGFAQGLKEGLLSIRAMSPSAQALYALHTLGIWLMYYLMSYLLFFSTPETATLSARCALTTLIMGGIGMALPSPGGIGTYHAFVAATFIAYGFEEEAGKAFAFLMHSTQTFAIVVIGGLSLVASLLWKASPQSSPPQ